MRNIDNQGLIFFGGIALLSFVCANQLGENGVAVAGVIGMAVGALIGVWETLNTPKNIRRKQFETYVGSGKYGSRFRQDNRLGFALFLGILSGASAWIWLIIFAFVK